jgi:hypothetical protein
MLRLLAVSDEVGGRLVRGQPHSPEHRRIGRAGGHNVMLTKFNYSQTANIPEMATRLKQMQEVLELLDEGSVGDGKPYSLQDLDSYLRSLVSGQRESLGRTIAGSWSVAPNDEGMDSDARVEFIFVPTYLAIATLSRAMCEFPLLPPSIPNYSESLKRGMVFSSLRSLAGHGYEADLGAIEALRILSIGKVPWLLHRHPDFCAELRTVIDEVANNMAQRLLKGTAVGAWGADYSEGFRSAVETLRLTNDLDFMESFRAARADSTTISDDDLPW